MGSVFYNKKEEYALEVKDLPQTTESTESDHVVSSISQKTRLISFKNIFEKISFSSLTTTVKNIIGAINELKADYESRKHYYKELTVTSDQFGRIDFKNNIPITAYEVVANVTTLEQFYCVTPFLYHDGTWHSALLGDVDFVRITNKTVNVRVSYWD